MVKIYWFLSILKNFIKISVIFCLLALSVCTWAQPAFDVWATHRHHLRQVIEAANRQELEIIQQINSLITSMHQEGHTIAQDPLMHIRSESLLLIEYQENKRALQLVKKQKLQELQSIKRQIELFRGYFQTLLETLDLLEENMDPSAQDLHDAALARKADALRNAAATFPPSTSSSAVVVTPVSSIQSSSRPVLSSVTPLPPRASSFSSSTSTYLIILFLICAFQYWMQATTTPENDWFSGNTDPFLN